MMWLRHWAKHRRPVFLAAAAWLVASSAAAQGAVGSGPLTSSLVDTEPTSGVIRLGPLRLLPMCKHLGEQITEGRCVRMRRAAGKIETLELERY